MQVVCSYLFGAEPVHLIDVIGRPGADGTAQVRQSWTMPFTPGRRFGPDKPVFGPARRATARWPPRPVRRPPDVASRASP
ncbi:MAG: hypothetical protein DLM62_20880 [Pseudonocardiales bacterium]|nr:MAG: hypothetical protein DLM62_20880 [Pseudonocardiales bacterium]